MTELPCTTQRKTYPCGPGLTRCAMTPPPDNPLPAQALLPSLQAPAPQPPPNCPSQQGCTPRPSATGTSHPQFHQALVQECQAKTSCENQTQLLQGQNARRIQCEPGLADSELKLVRGSKANLHVFSTRGIKHCAEMEK